MPALTEAAVAETGGDGAGSAARWTGSRWRSTTAPRSWAKVPPPPVPCSIGAAVSERGEAHAMFATGNSQLPFVEAVTPADVPWSDVVVFHMDEYVGVGPDHPAGFQRWIRQRITERAPEGRPLRRRVGRAGRRNVPSTPTVGRASRSISAAWASARTGTWLSMTPAWPTSTIPWTSRRWSSTSHAGSSRWKRALRRPLGRAHPGDHRDRPGPLARPTVLAVVPEARKPSRCARRCKVW